MGIFGWSYPPGCSGPPEHYASYSCEVCGTHADDCECPECPTCGEAGNPACYGEGTHKVYHRDALKRSLDQCHSLALRMEADRNQEADARAEGAYWASPERKAEAAALEKYWAELEAHERSRS